jgi:hypothetical protein
MANSGQRRTRNRRRRAQGSKWIYGLKKVKKFLRQNAIALSSIIVTVITGFVIYYLSYAKPDIRIVSSEQLVTVEQKVDEDKNIRMLMRSRDTYTNLSIKEGFIDRVEYTPTSLDQIPAIQVLSIDKEGIGWHDEKAIEITFAITIPMKEFIRATKDGRKEIRLEQRGYDNTGKLLNRYVNGDTHPIKVAFIMTTGEECTACQGLTRSPPPQP